MSCNVTQGFSPDIKPKSLREKIGAVSPIQIPFSADIVCKGKAHKDTKTKHIVIRLPFFDIFAVTLMQSIALQARRRKLRLTPL